MTPGNRAGRDHLDLACLTIPVPNQVPLVSSEKEVRDARLVSAIKDGIAWTGRGRMPRWLAAATKGGKAGKEDFLI